MSSDIEMQNIPAEKLREESDSAGDPWPEFRRRLCEVTRFVLIVFFAITGIAVLIVAIFLLGYSTCKSIIEGNCTKVFGVDTFFLGITSMCIVMLGVTLLAFIAQCISYTYEYIMEPLRQN